MSKVTRFVEDLTEDETVELLIAAVAELPEERMYAALNEALTEEQRRELCPDAGSDKHP